MLLFVTFGRFFHDEPIFAADALETGWPFAVGLLSGYVAVVFSRWPAVTLGAGLLISVKLTVLAVLLRSGIADDPIPLPFVLTSAFSMVGGACAWRAVALRRLNGAWPRDARTGLGRRSRLDFLRPRRRTRIFNR